MSTKLSKRKQKALAFRGKKLRADTAAENHDERTELEKAIPLNDDNDAAHVPETQPDEQTPSSWLGKDVVKGTSTKPKRKREEQDKEDDNTKEKRPKTSKPKKNKSIEKPNKPPAPKRFIVFLGNLPHLPPTELTPLLNTHFPQPPTHIRIPTKKGSNAPQGFAFAEFDTSAALEKALRCHHTTLGGRKINVELTAGGGGKSEARMGKIRGKNENLEEERKKRIEEEKRLKEQEDKKAKVAGGIHPDRLKRMKA